MSAGRLGERELTRLLDVGRALVVELDLESVLRQVLDVARELTQARYAALGILDERKLELERFLYVGIDEETRRAIGPLPRGRGILGELIRNPRALRLREVSEHPRSYGFPSGHPAMTSFLGVPIVIRGEAFGNLYLAEKQDGEFDEADEESAVVLAEWAAIAIDNARLYERVESRRDELERAVRGLEATTAIARAVGAETDLDRVLELIVKRGRALVNARVAMILMPGRDGLRVAAGAGELEPDPAAKVLPSEGTVVGEVLRTGEPELLPDFSTRVRHGLDEIQGRAESALLVPLLFRGRPQGVLVALDRLQPGPAFEPDDQHLLTSFAAAAANAIATAQSVEAERLRNSIEASEQERRRWARELHDETLQELGALRVMLTTAVQANDESRLRGAVERAMEQIGTTIAGLQSLITELRPAALDELGPKPAIEALVERTRATSGLEIELELDLSYAAGRQPTRLVPEVESTMYRLVQEALTNVVKHADANRVRVSVVEDATSVALSVRDDGKGFDQSAAEGGFGLVGMRERLELVGGSLQIDSMPGEGTTVRARLPAPHRGELDSTAVQAS